MLWTKLAIVCLWGSIVVSGGSIRKRQAFQNGVVGGSIGFQPPGNRGDNGPRGLQNGPRGGPQRPGGSKGDQQRTGGQMNQRPGSPPNGRQLPLRQAQFLNFQQPQLLQAQQGPTPPQIQEPPSVQRKEFIPFLTQLPNQQQSLLAKKSPLVGPDPFGLQSFGFERMNGMGRKNVGARPIVQNFGDFQPQMGRRNDRGPMRGPGRMGRIPGPPAITPAKLLAAATLAPTIQETQAPVATAAPVVAQETQAPVVQQDPAVLTDQTQAPAVQEQPQAAPEAQAPPTEVQAQPETPVVPVPLENQPPPPPQEQPALSPIAPPPPPPNQAPQAPPVPPVDPVPVPPPNEPVPPPPPPPVDPAPAPVPPPADPAIPPAPVDPAPVPVPPPVDPAAPPPAPVEPAPVPPPPPAEPVPPPAAPQPPVDPAVVFPESGPPAPPAPPAPPGERRQRDVSEDLPGLAQDSQDPQPHPIIHVEAELSPLRERMRTLAGLNVTGVQPAATTFVNDLRGMADLQRTEPFSFSKAEHMVDLVNSEIDLAVSNWIINEEIAGELALTFGIARESAARTMLLTPADVDEIEIHGNNPTVAKKFKVQLAELLWRKIDQQYRVTTDLLADLSDALLGLLAGNGIVRERFADDIAAFFYRADKRKIALF